MFNIMAWEMVGRMNETFHHDAPYIYRQLLTLHVDSTVELIMKYSLCSNYLACASHNANNDNYTAPVGCIGEHRTIIITFLPLARNHPI